MPFLAPSVVAVGWTCDGLQYIERNPFALRSVPLWLLPKPLHPRLPAQLHGAAQPAREADRSLRHEPRYDALVLVDGMRVTDSLLNKAEEVAFRELDAIAKDNNLRLFAKPRLSDVLKKDGFLPSDVFNFYTRSHVDFVVTDKNTKPLFIVEYDGPSHAESRQQERDQIKDALCKEAGLGLLRINTNYITRQYRGISVLRWIIEVTELEKAFYNAQEKGYIAWDEPFDPASVSDDGRGKRWPYWLSFSAIQALNSFARSGNVNKRRGYAIISGSDALGNLRGLSYMWNGEVGILAKVSVRNQNFDFPIVDLLHELSICELSEKMILFQSGKIQGMGYNHFMSVLKVFGNKYNATPNFFMGWGPPGLSWDFSAGWKFG
ncbi:DUF2726 domain-containing protein [Elioraea sp.]|uniref:DUF2726 domain-containing protein n=1 Tax=Elioraea sp. TaxID=2185103 RepID=UPI003F728AE1